MQTLHLSDAGGITQFGAYLETLAPGAMVVEPSLAYGRGRVPLRARGRPRRCATMTAMHDLRPGDAVCWRHGDPNAHHIRQPQRRAGALPDRRQPRRRATSAIYPDSGRGRSTRPIAGRSSRPTARSCAKANCPPNCGTCPRLGHALRRQPGAATPARQGAVWETDSGYVHPDLGGGLGPYRPCDARRCRRAVAVRRASRGTCRPAAARPSATGTRPRMRLLLMSSTASAVLIEDGETTLGPGDAPAGPPVARSAIASTTGRTARRAISSSARGCREDVHPLPRP